MSDHDTSSLIGDSPSPTPTTSPIAKLLKIPPIPIRGNTRSDSDEEEEEEVEDEDDEEEEEKEEENGYSSAKVLPFGLNYIRTRSIPSPLGLSSPSRDDFERSNSRAKIDQSSPLISMEQGRKVHWIHSNSGKNLSPNSNQALEGNYSAYAKEIQSPRFQAILRVTSGRKKRPGGDVKSFSHELNSKGVRAFPVWRPRALGHAEEVMAAIRAKFDKLKEEVDDDLGAFGSDLVGIIHCPGVAADMKSAVEDLLLVARRCVKMEPDEFWVKCEAIVQELDDKRQDLSPGLVKQAHTRMLFILTRCTRLVQFQKETVFDDDRILGLHQLSDLGVYPDQLLEALHRDISGENPPPKSASYRMASWRKLPSPAAKHMHKKKAEKHELKPEPEHHDLDHDHHHHDQDNHHQQQQQSPMMICRICEVEIPTAHAEEHSRICTLADRCDLKGLNVDERLRRVAETLEKLAEPTAACSSPGREWFPRKKSEEENDVCSGGSVTPRSPLMTPRTGHVELLLVNGRKTTAELENHDQILKLMEVAQAVANVKTCNYSALQYMVERLEFLKYVIQDRKVDGLVVETFGRCIEKLIQEKYVQLSGLIEDEKVEHSNCMVDEESSVEDDTVRSVRTSPLRTSPMNACPRDRTTIEDFEIIKPISRGAFGRVFLAKKRSTGDLFAIKVLKKADMIRKNAVESILAERNILIALRNPFVVRFYYSFTCRENLYLVMEYLNGGDLYSMLRNLGCLDEDMARVYIAEVVLALEYLHSLNVIHRDLKPDNLLIGQDGHIKLTDFGLSKVGLINSTDDLSAPSVSGPCFLGDDVAKTPRSSKREARQKQSVVGTPDYLAPEILLGMGHGITADWWSVGVILFELLVGVPPFNADHPQKIFDNIINRDIPWPRTPEEMSFEAYDIIDKLLTENPVQRLGATGAGEVKKHPFFKDINWDTLERQKAMFIPTIDEAHDTSYFMSRLIWNPEDDQVNGGSDFDDMTETCSTASYSYSNVHSEDGDECGSLAEFSSPAPAVRYSFSNFSFKNLSQLASINYDLIVKSLMEASDKQPVP